MLEFRVLVQMIESPDPAALQDFLRRHLGAGDRLVQIAGECEVLYHGRAASLADAGDFLVIIKSDGSLQVQSARGIKPINWQPVSDDVRIEIVDGRAVLTSERHTPPESVRIVFIEPVLAQSLVLRDLSGFVLLGSEAQMQSALARHPGLIEPGLVLLDRELPTEVGGIDLFARDRQGRLVVVELKRGKATQDAVHQLHRYVDSVRALGDDPVRGILAAPGITAPALLQLQRLGLEFREVTALPIEQEQEQPSLFA